MALLLNKVEGIQWNSKLKYGMTEGIKRLDSWLLVIRESKVQNKNSLLSVLYFDDEGIKKFAFVDGLS